MKPKITQAVCLLALLSLATTLNAQLLQQDFSSSSTLTDYISATSPNSGQFNSIGSSGAGVTVSIVSNALQFVRASGNAGSFSRTNDFAGPPAAVSCKFDLTVLGNGSGSTTVATWMFGAGFGTANSTEANAKVHSRFSINVTTTPDQFAVRDVNASKTWSTNSGTQTITWIINNSGGPLTYTAPNSSQETVTNDASDLWVGTTRAIDDMAATSGTNALANFKFAVSGGTETITMDNFLITELTTGVVVPRPAVTYGPVLTNGNILVRFSGLTGTNYTVETTPAMAPATWTKLTNLTATAGEFELETTRSNNIPSQFYRAVYPSY